jgi:hypothetical protein
MHHSIPSSKSSRYHGSCQQPKACPKQTNVRRTIRKSPLILDGGKINSLTIAAGSPLSSDSFQQIWRGLLTQIRLARGRGGRYKHPAADCVCIYSLNNSLVSLAPPPHAPREIMHGYLSINIALRLEASGKLSSCNNSFLKDTLTHNSILSNCQ